MHMTFALEEAAHTMEEGVEQWAWVLDMSGFAFRHADPRFAQVRLHIIRYARIVYVGKSQSCMVVAQHMGPLFARHYPERLGVALIINAPRIFRCVYRQSDMRAFIL